MIHRPPPTIGPVSIRTVQSGQRLVDPTKPAIPIKAIVTHVADLYRVNVLDINDRTIWPLSTELGDYAAAMTFANAVDAPEGFTVEDLTGEGA